ncbi:CHAT domain-containing protein [Gymnopilus junonius]|uniref:CHAT domain-containing protein n=1 Tax=Gymnopilus junonius TaxID=109634 RepID=A0A9P5NEL6_GYMJU|nr:CHAT domain-containing protein [Gymnopilus junonius]
MSSHGVNVSCLNGEAATIINVEKEMFSCNSIHLACHGVQDAKDPLKSSFCLGDGHLELSEIIKKQIPQGDLAFLYACQTSKGNSELTEEAMHFAAGMLSMGYWSVVATMWAIQDEHGPVMAEEFYKHMLENGNGKIDGRKAAYALHHTTQHLQKKLDNTKDALLAWLPYVHYGV